MSAYLVDAETLAALATYWERKSSQPGRCRTPEQQIERACLFMLKAENGGQVDFKTCWHDANKTATKLLKILTPLAAVEQVLFWGNEESIKARYPDPDVHMDMLSPADGAGYLEGRSIPIVDHWIQQKTTGHMLAILQEYEYQSCESAGWEQSLAFMICEQIRQYLLEDLADRDCPDGRPVNLREAVAS